MASRLFKPLGGSLTQDVVLLTGKWTFTDTAGAIDTAKHEGFSVSTSSSGEQTITLSDAYNALVGVSITYEAASGTFDSDNSTSFEVSSETVSTDKEIVIQHIRTGAGTTQTDAALSGKSVRCMIWLKNSSV